jgi:hypothetical protein
LFNKSPCFHFISRTTSAVILSSKSRQMLTRSVHLLFLPSSNCPLFTMYATRNNTCSPLGEREHSNLYNQFVNILIHCFYPN